MENNNNLSGTSFITLSSSESFLAYYITSKELAQLFGDCHDAECLEEWNLTIAGEKIILSIDDFREYSEWAVDSLVPKSLGRLLDCLGAALSDDTFFVWETFTSGCYEDGASLALLEKLHNSHKNRKDLEKTIIEARVEGKDDDGYEAIYVYDREKHIDNLQEYHKEPEI